MTDTIICPHCQQSFELSQAMSSQLREQLKGEMAKGLEEELHRRLSQESKRLADEAAKTARAQLVVELEDLKARAEASGKQLAEFQAKELDLRKRARELEEKAQQMALNHARQLDAERQKIEEQTVKKVLEERRLHDLEKDKLLSDLKGQIEELKHKAEVGSQQSRGEIQELDLESLLRASFSQDDIEPVGKGVLGADVVQLVRNKYGQPCERIVWESKRTKHWSEQWIDKLKDDCRKMNGFVSVLVTDTLPADINGFSYYKGIWVTDYRSIVGLATALRMQIIHVCHVRDSVTGKDEKMTLIYDYLTSHQFRGRVEAIVETFQTMRSDLEREREAMRRLWAKREKEIERITENTVGMYGDMQGMIGASLPTLPALDLMAISEESSKPTSEQ